MSTVARRSVSGVILAGGESRRMGIDKATLVFEGKTFLERMVESLENVVEEIFVVGRPNPFTIRWRHSPQFVPDIWPGRGPLGGIYTGLSLSKTPWALFVPCDMPLIDEWIYVRLLTEGAWPSHREGLSTLLESCASILAFQNKEGNGIEHFPLLVSKTVLRLVRNLLKRGENSVKSLLIRASVEKLALDELGRKKIQGFNSTEEYAALIKNGKELDPLGS